MFSKALENRLTKVIDQVIHVDQSYCISGRFIRDNISLIREVFDISSSSSLDVNFGLISFDQEKAFDQVEHHCMEPF